MSSLLGKIKSILSSSGGSGSIIGIDIGLSSIKACELGKGSKNKYKILSYSMVPLEEAAIIEDEIQKPEDIIKAIEEAIDNLGTSSKNVCLGLSGNNTMTKRMQVPDGTNEEIEDHIIWESEQYIPFGAEETELDFNIIADNEGGGKDSIVAAARTDIMESFIEVVEDAGLKVKIVDFDVFAISNVFEHSYQDEIDEYEDGTILIDFGAQSTKVIVYKKGAPVFTKELNWGGVFITEEIQRSMGVSYREAEDLKVMGDSSGNLPEEIVNIVSGQLSSHIDELKKVLNFYVQAGSSERVEHCFVTGGNSNIPRLKELLEKSLLIKIHNLDISQGIDFTSIGESNLEYIQSTGAVSIGLALRGFL